MIDQGDREEKAATCGKNIILVLHKFNPASLYIKATEIERQFDSRIFIDVDSREATECLKPPVLTITITIPDDIYKIREYLLNQNPGQK